MYYFLYGMLYLIIFKGNGYTLKGDNSVIDFACFEKGSALKGKNLLPMGANSFLLEKIPLQKYLGLQEVTSCLPVTKWQKILQVYQCPLIVYIWFQVILMLVIDLNLNICTDPNSEARVHLMLPKQQELCKWWVCILNVIESTQFYSTNIVLDKMGFFFSIQKYYYFLISPRKHMLWVLDEVLLKSTHHMFLLRNKKNT